MNVERITYPRDQLADALLTLCRRVRWAEEGDQARLARPQGPHAPTAGDDGWLGAYAESLGIRAQPIRLDHGELRDFLAGTGPALLRPIGDPDLLVAIEQGGPRHCRIAGPADRRISTEALQDLLAQGAGPEEDEDTGPRLHLPGLSTNRLAAVQKALRAEQLRDRPAAEGWVLEPPAGAPFLRQLRAAGVPGSLVTLGICHALSSLLVLAGWWTIGRGALEGGLDRGWLWAWVLLLFTTLPLQAVELERRGVIAWVTGALLKRRLLEGALKLRPDEVRGQGAGKLLGRVIDSERIESLAINGGLTSLLTVLELALAVVVLAAGAVPIVHLMLLSVWILILAAVAGAYLRRNALWTRKRLDMTHRLVERLVGHRTRLAQEPRHRWHDAEDLELEGYALASADLDRWFPRLHVLVPRGWLLTALAALLPPALTGGLGATGLAVSLGGMLLALGALRSLAAAASEIGAAAIAWRHVGPLYEAARRPPVPPAAGAEAEVTSGVSRILEADDLGYRHDGRAHDAVDACCLEIRPRDRLLLEGPSGGGKSTLATVLAGLRRPQRGWLGLHGLDLDVWGEEAWGRRVAYVPQFHDNHLLTAPLAFNLLMGHSWPATPQDLEEAKSVCEELGLGPLLEQMPAGLMQPVGDSGWQLSQGEKTRVYLARALLQGADLVILDESFAGLDLKNLEKAMACADRRAAALLVIAHP